MSVQQMLDRYRRDREYEIAEASVRQRERLVNELANQAAATEDVAMEVSRMAAVADWALPAIVEHLALTAEHLGGVERMLANPTETAAAEFYRRGSFALASGWVEEAEADLSEAVKVYPYNPRTWFNLGVARQRLGSGDSAADAYVRCARYSANNDPALAARAVLLAAFLYRGAESPDLSNGLLREYADKLDRCAELHLSAGVHHNDHDHLVRALVLAPELAADAQAAGAAGTEEAATVVCRMTDGPVRQLHNLEQAAERLIDIAYRAGLQSVRPAPAPVDLPADSVDALLLAVAALPSALHAINLLAAEIYDESSALQVTADRANKRRDELQAEASRLAHVAQHMDAQAAIIVGSPVRIEAATGRAGQAKKDWQQSKQRGKQVMLARFHEWKQAEQDWQQAVRQVEQAWQQITDFASWGRDDDEMRRRVQAARQRFEADQPDKDRVETLQHVLGILIIDSAHQPEQNALAAFSSAARVAAEADRVARQAAELVVAAKSTADRAKSSTTGPRRIVPFDLPSHWKDLDDTA
jgi:tetratricopeptide (TPR) repeat protein